MFYPHCPKYSFHVICVKLSQILQKVFAGFVLSLCRTCRYKSERCISSTIIIPVDNDSLKASVRTYFQLGCMELDAYTYIIWAFDLKRHKTP